MPMKAPPVLCGLMGSCREGGAFWVLNVLRTAWQYIYAHIRTRERFARFGRRSSCPRICAGKKHRRFLRWKEMDGHMHTNELDAYGHPFFSAVRTVTFELYVFTRK